MSGYLVEAKTVQTGAIRTLIEALKCILVEMNFSFDNDGIKMIAMDNTRTVLVHMRLEASNFEKYNVEKSFLSKSNFPKSIFRKVTFLKKNNIENNIC
jgi:DNA polymerase III sliding clamp (beta) subunit (PCNA family)